MRRARRRREAGEQDRIVERGAHLADAAANAVSELPVEDDAGDAVAGGCRARADGIVEGEDAVWLYEAAAELARGDRDVLPAAAGAVVRLVAREHAVDGGEVVVRDGRRCLSNGDLRAHGQRERCELRCDRIAERRGVGGVARVRRMALDIALRRERETCAFWGARERGGDGLELRLQFLVAVGAAKRDVLAEERDAHLRERVLEQIPLASAAVGLAHGLFHGRREVDVRCLDVPVLCTVRHGERRFLHPGARFLEEEAPDLILRHARERLPARLDAEDHAPLVRDGDGDAADDADGEGEDEGGGHQYFFSGR